MMPRDTPSRVTNREVLSVLPFPDADNPQRPLNDPIQRRYELIRPVLLNQDRTATQRAQETGAHPETVGRLKRRFDKQGLRGLLPDTLAVVPAGRRRRVPDEVVQELQRLKGLYEGFGSRELARIVFHTTTHRITGQTAKRLWDQLSPAPPRQLPLLDYHSHPECSQARREVIALHFHGWSKRSISAFWHVSRPTINAWIARFEADNLESLEDKRHTPTTTRRKAWLPAMVEISHLQKRHPDAGGFRIWSLRGKSDLAVRTVERIMARNRQVYQAIPGVGSKRRPTSEPQPHPCKAKEAHQYWFIDGRMMDFALAGHRWWSLIILDGYSRTMLAGAVAPSEASWVALTVLYTACLRYGIPQHVLSDSGGAFTADAFEGVCDRLGLDHQTIVSTEGQSDRNLMETHFNVQRRLYDYQVSLTCTPLEFEQAHQRFLELYHTTAHQGLLKEPCASPLPLDVLGEAKGRLYSAEELDRKFAHALLPRTTNRYGCVTLHSYHFYVDQGLPQKQVLLWVYGQELRAVFDNVLVAEYHCRYDLRERKVKDIRIGRFSPSPFASRQQQGSLLDLNPSDSVVVYRPRSVMCQGSLPFPAEPLWLFEQVESA
jgi:Integrase core domain/Homeodomain-like domain